MKMRYGFEFGIVVLSIALLGIGCSSPGTQLNESVPPEAVSHPQPLTLEGLNPLEAAKKIQFVAGNSLLMHQAFTGAGKALAESIGLGPSIERQIVIRRFAPRNVAEIDWKTITKVQGVQKQYVGTLKGSNLRDSHSLFPSVYWKEGDGTAVGTGMLWLSQDVYEDLAKIHLSTLKFGLEDGELLGFASSSPQLRQSIRSLQSAMVKAMDRTDVFATRATTGTQTLMINGATSTVEVLIAKNWFGEMRVLHNPENPLVLSATLSKPGGIDFGGLFDYTITELKDLQM